MAKLVVKVKDIVFQAIIFARFQGKGRKLCSMMYSSTCSTCIYMYMYNVHVRVTLVLLGALGKSNVCVCGCYPLNYSPFRSHYR